MAYVLQPISPEDHESIIGRIDIGNVGRTLYYLSKQGGFPRQWAITHEDAIAALKPGTFTLDGLYDERLFI
ncbi:MAG: hypothetical protein ACI9BW_004009 [Gammaproteobacteria bacterium]|jgi:hypothetical protein